MIARSGASRRPKKADTEGPTTSKPKTRPKAHVCSEWGEISREQRGPGVVRDFYLTQYILDRGGKRCLVLPKSLVACRSTTEVSRLRS